MLDETYTEATPDRFRAVDTVAKQIFDTMPDLGQGEETDLTAETPLGAGETDALRHPSHTLLAKTERYVSALVQALEDRNKALQAAAQELSRKQHPSDEQDISFHAARRRSQLPEGVEMLESAPSPTSEDEMMASIRALIDEQQAEQKAVAIEKRRAESRRALPPLEPQELVTVARAPAPKTIRKPTLLRRVRTTLRSAFQKDFFLACALSIWGALAMAVFIEPSVSGKLFGISLFLLFVASCLFPDHDACETPRPKQAMA